MTFKAVGAIAVAVLTRIFQLLRLVVCTILSTVAAKLPGQLIVLFCTVPEETFLLRWNRAWGDRAGMAFPFEYETQKKQKQWKSQSLQPAGLSRYRRSG